MPGPVNENQSPAPVYVPKFGGNFYVSTVLSTGLSGITSGSTIDVQGLTHLTAFIDRQVSTTAVELEVSPDGSTWYNWATSSSLTALPAAGEFASLNDFVTDGTVGFVRAIPNVSATFTSACIVQLNAFTK